MRNYIWNRWNYNERIVMVRLWFWTGIYIFLSWGMKKNTRAILWTQERMMKVMFPSITSNTMHVNCRCVMDVQTGDPVSFGEQVLLPEELKKGQL